MLNAKEDILKNVGNQTVVGEREIARLKWDHKCVRTKSLPRFDKVAPRRPIAVWLRVTETRWLHMLSIRSRGTSMSYNDRSVWRCFKLNTPHHMSSPSEPVRFDGTLPLKSACKHIVVLELLHCEWSRHRVRKFVIQLTGFAQVQSFNQSHCRTVVSSSKTQRCYKTEWIHIFEQIKWVNDSVTLS